MKNKEVDQFIADAPIEQQEILSCIRQLIFQTVSSIKEEYKWNRPVYKTNEMFAYLQTSKNYVTLGFYKGFEKINDSKNLLEGTGKTMRHIKLRSMENVDQKMIVEWLKAITE